MNPQQQRAFISCGLLFILYVITITNFTYLFFTFLLVASIIECILRMSPYSVLTLYILLPTLLFVNVQICDEQDLSIYLRILIYNSISDMIQYLGGRLLGKTKLFTFTEKTKEGYIAGITLTFAICDVIVPTGDTRFRNNYLLLNLAGMIGGIISSKCKRNLGIKHWSNLLGPHGGINDRLDSWMLPSVYFYLFIK